MGREINYRNLAIVVLVSLPIGIAFGLYAIPAVGVWWTMAVAAPTAVLSGLLLGLLGFRIRS